ncbi:MAG TPA: hypothetical protein VGC74_17330 [Stenotrophomonas sp.]|jgi:hypothetical protein
MNWLVRTIALSTLCLAGPAFAAAKVVPLDLHTSAEAANKQLQTINTQMNDGETFAEISPEDRSRVREALGRITGALEKANGHPLTPEAETQAFNDQEIVNTLLTQAKDDSRVVCERERQMGSNRITSKCMTVAERRRLREQGEKAVRDLSQRQLTRSPGAGR